MKQAVPRWKHVQKGNPAIIAESAGGLFSCFCAFLYYCVFDCLIEGCGKGYGVLFGSSAAHKALRKELVENQKLTAVISMPSGVFKPYAGVSTAILVFTKTNAGGTDKVWFYDMKADGYSLDDKRSEIKDNDIPDVIKRFHSLDDENSRERTEQSFFVCKTVSPYAADRWSDGQIPPWYVMQVQHYLAVSGCDCWYIAALVFGKDFIIRRIDRDEDVRQCGARYQY